MTPDAGQSRAFSSSDVVSGPVYEVCPTREETKFRRGRRHPLVSSSSGEKSTIGEDGRLFVGGGHGTHFSAAPRSPGRSTRLQHPPGPAHRSGCGEVPEDVVRPPGAEVDEAAPAAESVVSRECLEPPTTQTVLGSSGAGGPLGTEDLMLRLPLPLRRPLNCTGDSSEFSSAAEQSDGEDFSAPQTPNFGAPVAVPAKRRSPSRRSFWDQGLGFFGLGGGGEEDGASVLVEVETESCSERAATEEKVDRHGGQVVPEDLPEGSCGSPCRSRHSGPRGLSFDSVASHETEDRYNSINLLVWSQHPRLQMIVKKFLQRLSWSHSFSEKY